MMTKKERMAPPGKYRVIAFSKDLLIPEKGHVVGDYSPGFAFRIADENNHSRSRDEDYHVFNEWGVRVYRNGEKISARDYCAPSQVATLDLEIEDGESDE